MERIEKAVEKIGVLVAETTDLATKTTELATEVRKDRVERQRHRRLYQFLSVLVALMVTGMLSIGIANRVLLTRQADLQEQIRNCATAGQPCYEAELLRTQQAVAEIARRNVQANVEIVSCSRLLSDKDFRACVTEKTSGGLTPN